MHVNNVPDVYLNGKWIKSWVDWDGDDKIQYNTRASICYRGMEARCKDSPKLGRLQTYEDCVNLFGGFQEFTEWCQDQHGYMNKELNGKFWQLDKDLYSTGNRIYSEETCLFIPQRINCLFTNPRTKLYELPIGVIYKVKTEVMKNERTKPYEARCNNSKGKQLSGGFFADKLQAHFSYLGLKIGVIESIMKEDVFSKHSKLLNFLENRVEILKHHLNNKIELIDI